MTWDGSPRATAATIAEVCDRHIAGVPNPRTAATYRARLRPLMRRFGARPAHEALLALAEIEHELTAERGAQGAHKAVILLKAALRSAGFELLTLVDAASCYGHAVVSLRALADDGRVRCRYRRRHGRGESLLFDPGELAEDLARLPRCLAAGCEQAGTGSTGYCGEHFGEGGRERARDAEDETLAGKRDWWTISEAARRAGEPRATIQAAADRGDLPSEKVGRHRRIPKKALSEWRKTKRRGPHISTHEERDARRLELRKMWEQGCRQPGALAAKLGVSKPTIYNDLEACGLKRVEEGRASRKLPPAERAARAARVVERYARGSSYAEIERDQDVSQTEIGRILHAAGVTPRPQRRKAKGPPPGPRACEYCGDTFTPRAPAFGGQRFCGSDHWKAARARDVRDALDERGLLATDALGMPGIGQHEVLVHIKAGRLKAERIEVLGGLRPVYGVAPKERDQFARSFAREGDGRRRVMEDPVQLLARWQGNGTVARRLAAGFTLDEVRAVAHDHARARRAYFAPLRRTGRPPGGKPSARDLRWLDRYEELVAERDDHTERIALGIVAESDGAIWTEAKEFADASDTQLAKMVARADWREHPECWDLVKYPPSSENPAEMRVDRVTAAGGVVRKAIKRLQSTGTRSPAADFVHS